MGNEDSETWYIARADQRVGPIDRSTLNAFHQAGKLKATDLIWSNTLGGWTPATHLFSFTNDEPPPLPAAQIAGSSPPPIVRNTSVKAKVSASAIVGIVGSIVGVATVGVVSLTGFPSKLDLSSPLASITSLVEDVPSEAAARTSIEVDALDGGFSLISFRKTNGQKGKMLGVDIYSMQFEARVNYPNGLNLKCKKPPPGSMVQCMGVKVIDAGGSETVTGSVTFEKTENGWRRVRL